MPFTLKSVILVPQPFATKEIFQPPAELYDSMIFVTDANPTKILEE